MKTNFLTICLLAMSIAAMAQQSRTSNTRMSINDDDKTMSIQVNGSVNGREINYNRRFRVVGMTKQQKDALKNRVLDSLGIGQAPKPPVVPKPPKAPEQPQAATRGEFIRGESTPGEETVTVRCETCTGKMRLAILGDGYSMTRNWNSGKETNPAFPMTLMMKPGKYRYTYRQNGVEQIQLSFVVKTGEANVLIVK